MDLGLHIFISYAHLDNDAPGTGGTGWVTQFHDYLESFVSENLGEKARIWRDEKLKGTDVFAEEIVSQFPKTAVMLSILSPRYLKSEWCTREVNRFYEAVKSSEGVQISPVNKTRIVKVMRQPVPVDEQPEVLQQSLGYEFFTEWEGRTLPLDPAFGKKFDEEYRRKLYILSQDVAELVHALTEIKESQKANSARKTPHTVFLAECAKDRQEDREKIRGELRALGYAVLPDREMPIEQKDYEAEVDRLLDRCQLSVHLIGSTYGPAFDDEAGKPTSRVVLQNKLAAAKSKSKGLPRLIWLPEKMNAEHEQQRAFIASLITDTQMQAGADLISGDSEIFKREIYAALEKIERADQEASTQDVAPGASGASGLVYLICDDKDQEAVLPIEKYLTKQGLSVELPQFSGDAEIVSEANQLLLGECDAVLLYWGAGDRIWKLHQDANLRKYLSLREKVPLANITYLAGPSIPEKERLASLGRTDVVDGSGGYSDGLLDGFVQLLQK